MARSQQKSQWATVIGVACAAVAVAVALRIWGRSRKTRRGKRLPEPEGCHPLWGAIPLLTRLVKPGDHIDKAIALIIARNPQLGGFFGLNFVVRSFAAVTDPAAAFEIVVKQNLPKSPTYNILYPFIGRKSMVVAHGQTWSRLRKAFNPAFTTQYLRSLVPLFADCGRRLLPRLDKAMQEKSVILIHKEMTLLAMDIIMQAFMSLDLDYLSPEGPPDVFYAFTELFQTTATLALRPQMNVLRYLPWKWLRFQWLQYKFDLCLVPEICRCLKESEAGAAQRSAPPSGRVDMLSMALRTAKAEGLHLGLDDVLAQVKTFLFAGHDTSSSTLSFAIYETSRNPEVQAKLLQEVDRVCKGELPTAEHVSLLTYCGAIIKETLRMWPVGGTARMGPKGTDVQGYEVGNTVLYVPYILIHRDPAIWGPSAGSFVPERWLDEAFVSTLHPCAYMPFSRGARDCIGQTFATMEMKVVLALLYQRYTFKYAGAEPEEQGYSITSYPKHHTPVMVHARPKL